MKKNQNPDYITPKRAQEMVVEAGLPKVVINTIYDWIHRYSLGRRFGGRFLIDKKKFEEFLNGDEISEKQT